MTEEAMRSSSPVRFAVSKAGHDKGMLYCIIAETPDAYLLCDGRIRTVERPKKKNKKHVQLIKHIPEEIMALCRQNGTFYNEGIRYALKSWSGNVSEAQVLEGDRSECRKQTQ